MRYLNICLFLSFVVFIACTVTEKVNKFDATSVMNPLLLSDAGSGKNTTTFAGMDFRDSSIIGGIIVMHTIENEKNMEQRRFGSVDIIEEIKTEVQYTSNPFYSLEKGGITNDSLKKFLNNIEFTFIHNVISVTTIIIIPIKLGWFNYLKLESSDTFIGSGIFYKGKFVELK